MGLVGGFVFFLVPELEGVLCLGVEDLLAGYGALVARECELVVDEGVVEVDEHGVVFGVGVEDFFDACPIECAEAHGAWFAGGVDGAVVEFEGLELCAGLSDGGYFGVCGWVVVGGYAVDAGGDDFAVACDDGAEGAAAVEDVLFG